MKKTITGTSLGLDTTTVAAGTTIIGFGAGVIFVSYPGIQELLPNKYRGAGIGWTEFCINIPWGALSVYLATQLYVHTSASWRWCFYIVIIYSVFVIAGTAYFYYLPSRPQHDYENRGGTSSGNSISHGGIDDHRGRGCVFRLFAYDFSSIPRNPIFPRKLFALFREFTVHLVILFVSGMIWQGVVTLGPQGTPYVFTNDPIQIGMTMIPANFSGVLGGWILPSLVHRIKHVRYQILLALVVQIAFTASYAAIVPTNKAAWSAMQLFGQSTFTWVTSLAYVASGLAVNKHLGGNIVAAAIGSGCQATPENLDALVPAVIENAVGVSNAFSHVPVDVSDAVKAATSLAFHNTYTSAFRLVFYTMVPFGVLALGCAWFVRDPSHLLNNHIAVHQEKEVLSGIDHRNENMTTVTGGRAR